MTFVAQSDIGAIAAHGPWRGLEQIAAIAVKDAERIAGISRGMNPILGGGTRLMLAMKHRISDDVDLFIHDPQWIGYLTPRKNDLLDGMVTSYDEGATSLKLCFKEGEIDFIVRSPLLGLPDEKTSDCHFELEHPAEVLAKKLFHRGWALTPRDLFDWKSLEERYSPEELHTGEIAELLKGRSNEKIDLIENSLKVLKDSPRQENHWENIRTSHLPDYRETVEWALSRLDQFKSLNLERAPVREAPREVLTRTPKRNRGLER